MAEHATQMPMPGTDRPSLKRALTLPLVVLYGLGVTIGAGIYVLIGATASVAGVYAPLSFLLAALVMLPSACSFAELVGRCPVSAGEAAYVREGLRSRPLSVLVGLMVVGTGTVSAAAITVGSVGYIQQFVDLPAPFLVPLIVLFVGMIAALGIVESVSFAATLTLIEIGGLLLIIGAGLTAAPELSAGIVDAWPSELGDVAWGGVFGAGLLAFYAFVGFEDMVNVAEETRRPERTMPYAIFITLAVTVLLYVLVSTISVLLVPVDDLSAAKAPLGLVFERVTGLSPWAISAIAVIATLNGVIVQIIMGSRVIYGLSRQGSLPAVLGSVSGFTRSPLIATALIALLVYCLAALFPLQDLAEMTSRITLTVFALVNLSLLAIKRRGDPAPPKTFIIPAWVPAVGLVSSILLFLGDIF